jgi:hypothetical protein
MRTESLVAPSPPAGKRFLDARDERPQTAPERSFFLTETVNGQMHPPQTAAFENGKIVGAANEATHSALMFAALMIGHHFSISAF